MNKLTKEETMIIHTLASIIKEQVSLYNNFPTESILDSIVRFTNEIQEITSKQ